MRAVLTHQRICDRRIFRAMPQKVPSGRSTHRRLISGSIRHGCHRDRRLPCPRNGCSWVAVGASGRDAIHWKPLHSTHAGVAELADAPGLGPGAERRPGSSPGTRTDRHSKGFLPWSVATSSLLSTILSTILLIHLAKTRKGSPAADCEAACAGSILVKP